MTYLQQEIHYQPEAIKKSLAFNREVLDRLAVLYKKSGFRNIIIAARGSSRNACSYFKYLCEIYSGVNVTFVSPSAVTLYEGNIDFSGSFFLAVSQSGMGEDIIAVTRKAKAHGAYTVTMTNNSDSLLAKEGAEHIYMNCGEEFSVPATKTFTVQASLLAYFAGRLAESDEIISALDLLPAAAEKLISGEADIERLAENFTDISEVIILGRGLCASLMDEMCLKMKETTYINASCYTIPDFYHGPFALADGKRKFVLIKGRGKGFADAAEMEKRLLENDNEPFILSDIAGSGDFILPELPEPVSPVIYVIFMQILVLKLALKKGINPDSPRGLKKITVTR